MPWTPASKGSDEDHSSRTMSVVTTHLCVLEHLNLTNTSLDVTQHRRNISSRFSVASESQSSSLVVVFESQTNDRLHGSTQNNH